MKFTETERRLLVTRAEGGRNGELLLMGTELQFCKLKSSADCLNNMNVLNITGYLKMVKMISFTCVLPQFFLKSTISFLRYLCAFDLCKFNRRQINAPYLELIDHLSPPHACSTTHRPCKDCCLVNARKWPRSVAILEEPGGSMGGRDESMSWNPFFPDRAFISQFFPDSSRMGTDR